MPGTWVRSDAWVLAVIAGYWGERCSLTDVVAAGDAINHAILMDAEVEHAVRLLLGADLIDTSERMFRLTAAGTDFVEHRRGGLVGQVDYLLPRLRRLPDLVGPWQLEPGELESAVRAYQRRAASRLREGRRRPT